MLLKVVEKGGTLISMSHNSHSGVGLISELRQLLSELTYSVAYFLFLRVRLRCLSFSMISLLSPRSFNFLLRSLMLREDNSSSDITWLYSPPSESTRLKAEISQICLLSEQLLNWTFLQIFMSNFLVATTLQSMMNTKLSKQRFWHCLENGLIKTIQTIPQLTSL